MECSCMWKTANLQYTLLHSDLNDKSIPKYPSLISFARRVIWYGYWNKLDQFIFIILYIYLYLKKDILDSTHIIYSTHNLFFILL